MDCSLPGSSLHGILQARVLEWVAISFSTGSSQPRVQTRVSCIPGRRFNLWATRRSLLIIFFILLLFTQSCPTLCNSMDKGLTGSWQAPLSMGFSRQEYWSGLPFPSPRDLPNPGIEPASPAWQADCLPLSHQGSSWDIESAYEGRRLILRSLWYIGIWGI